MRCSIDNLCRALLYCEYAFRAGTTLTLGHIAEGLASGLPHTADYPAYREAAAVLAKELTERNLWGELKAAYEYDCAQAFGSRYVEWRVP